MVWLGMMEYMTTEHENDILQLWPNDRLFENSERICVFGSSGSGKSTFVVNLVKRHHESFHKIILCGQGNELLKWKGTAHKTSLHRAQSSADEIFDPFAEIDLHQLKKKRGQILLIYDDMQESVYKSPVISRIFSRGRHLGFSVILLLQSFFPQGAGQSLMPQIKNNCSVQVFLKYKSQSELGVIASKLEHAKADKEFFLSLFKRLVSKNSHTRFGYLAVFLDGTDSRTRYASNLLREDGSPHLTVYIKK